MVNSSRWLLIFISLLFVALGTGVYLTGASAQATGTVSGMVVDADGPVSEAIVRIRATENGTTTLADGRFSLGSLVEGDPVEVTAWADGYYIASQVVTPTQNDLVLTLRPYHDHDHPDYEWASPIEGSSENACGNCHPMIVTQWMNNAHGGAVFNPRFFSLYNGTNLGGSVEVGPGYQNDFPSTAGSCANCHAPGAAVDGYLVTEMNQVREVITAGVHCDFCHKIGGAFLNPATYSVYPNAPGVQSMRVLRPPLGDNIFFGPYDDIHDPDTYLPLMRESQFCAACHQFSFWGVPIYESYNEWLASPYPQEGITCQTCHMPPSGDTYFALPEVGGLQHPANTIPSHFQLGAANAAFLQNTVTMTTSVQQIGHLVSVSVRIANTNAGHHVPTDFPGRQMILVVTAEDEDGHTLTQVQGPSIPAWGGSQAGLAGTAYAKILMDLQSGESPVVSYWKQTQVVSDNRLPALAEDITDYVFLVPMDGGSVSIHTQLIFRRVFQSISDQKDWDKPDIIMEENQVMITTKPITLLYMPFVTRDNEMMRWWIFPK